MSIDTAVSDASSVAKEARDKTACVTEAFVSSDAVLVLDEVEDVPVDELLDDELADVALPAVTETVPMVPAQLAVITGESSRAAKESCFA